MTLVAIMNDESDPKMQMAAAKALLDKRLIVEPSLEPSIESQETAHLEEDDIHAAITLAKAILDELATRKTQKLDGQGPMAVEGASGTDNT